VLVRPSLDADTGVPLGEVLLDAADDRHSSGRRRPALRVLLHDGRSVPDGALAPVDGHRCPTDVGLGGAAADPDAVDVAARDGVPQLVVRRPALPGPQSVSRSARHETSTAHAMPQKARSLRSGRLGRSDASTVSTLTAAP
jgi:hypothetical protein